MGTIVNVLGLGPSIDLYNPDGNISIGVNDIWSKVKTDYIVCVDLPQRFTPDRLKVINDSNPIKFFSQFPTKENPGILGFSQRGDYEHIELLPYYPDTICQLNIPMLPKSLCSPFVACAIANNYLHATEIHLYGVDMTNHPNFQGKTIERILTHFRNFKSAYEVNDNKFIVHGDGVLKKL
jgi:hypothetical protein